MRKPQVTSLHKWKLLECLGVSPPQCSNTCGQWWTWRSDMQFPLKKLLISPYYHLYTLSLGEKSPPPNKCIWPLNISKWNWGDEQKLEILLEYIFVQTLVFSHETPALVAAGLTIRDTGPWHEHCWIHHVSSQQKKPAATGTSLRHLKGCRMFQAKIKINILNPRLTNPCLVLLKGDELLIKTGPWN